MYFENQSIKLVNSIINVYLPEDDIDKLDDDDDVTGAVKRVKPFVTTQNKVLYKKNI